MPQFGCFPLPVPGDKRLPFLQSTVPGNGICEVKISRVTVVKGFEGARGWAHSSRIVEVSGKFGSELSKTDQVTTSQCLVALVLDFFWT